MNAYLNFEVNDTDEVASHDSNVSVSAFSYSKSSKAREKPDRGDKSEDVKNKSIATGQNNNKGNNKTVISPFIKVRA